MHPFLRLILPAVLVALGALDTPPARAAAPTAVPYTLTTAGNVSAAIYDAQGRLVRELLRGQPMAPGTHTLQWDGLDRLGVAQPPGDYTWKLLRTPGFEATYLGAVGMTIVAPPYDPWVGNNDGPSAVAWDETGWYVGSIASETVPTYRKQSPDGRARLWQKDPMEAWQGPVAMASANGTLFVLQQNGKVISVATATGAHKGYGDDAGKNRPAGWDVLAPGDTRDGSGGRTSGAMDLDAYAEQFVVSYEKFNLVRWYATNPLVIPGRTSPTALQELSAAALLRTESIPSPTGVACGADGVTYVISKGTVLAIGKDTTLFIPAEQLTSPSRLACDRQTGDLLVAEGAPGHQLKRFDRKGQLTATYGRTGGRLDGPFAPMEFLNIRDVVATENGGFLLCEGGGSLRRTARFDRAGKLLGQWFGGSPYFNFASAAPEDPSEIWFVSGYTCYGVAKVDLTTGAWELTASYTLTAFGDGLFPVHAPVAQWHVRRRADVTYLAHDRGALLRVDPAKRRLVPVAIAGTVDKKHQLWLDAVAVQKLDATKLSGAYTWADLNGDGEFQPAEFRLGGQAPRGNTGNCHLDDQWNLTVGTDGAPAPWVRLLNRAPAGASAPVWDWTEAEPSTARWPEEITRIGGIESRGIWRDTAGATYQFIAANRAPTMDRHGGWPGNRNGSARVIKWDAAGNICWNVGSHGHQDAIMAASPGRYNDPARIIGLTHDTLVVADRAGWPATAWTLDGLYAGSFLDRRAADGLPARVYAVWREKRPLPDKPGQFENPQTMHADTPIPLDCLTGGSLVALGDGEVLWMPQGENAPPVYRVRGWTGWERQQGRLTVTATPPHAAATGTGLTAAYFTNPRLEGAPAHTRRDSRIWFGFKIDHGKWQPWSKPPVPGIGAQGFSARWTGMVEPPLTEAFTFSAYVGPRDRVRLWIGEQLVIDEWAPADPKRRRPKTTWAACDVVVSPPIALTAGGRVPLRLEYVSDGPEQGSLSLNWDSPTQERQRIPTTCLYPE
jgi:hypothetical protein